MIRCAGYGVIVEKPRVGHLARNFPCRGQQVAYQCPNSIKTELIKMAWACVTDEGQQTDGKCTSVEAKREKVKRTTKQKIDELY